MKIISSLIRVIIFPLCHKIFCRFSPAHLMAFARYNSLKKMTNFLKVYYEIKMGKSVVKSKPFVLFLETTNICNLHCNFCLCGKGKNGGRTKRHMSFEEMKRSLDEVVDYLYVVQLYNWGEPLLNPDLIKFIKYFHSKRVFTIISSNMNFTQFVLTDEIVRSGLDYFIAAIDGMSAATYKQYRRGGDFNKAIGNLDLLISSKRQLKSSTPFIEWQYVVFRCNEHEVEKAKVFSELLKVDLFNPVPGYIEDLDWLPTRIQYRVNLGQPESVKNCRRLWTHLNIRADGGVASCCYEYFKKDDFANLFDVSFSSVWNNDMFVSAREVVLKGIDNIHPSSHTICHRCIAQGVRPSYEGE